MRNFGRAALLLGSGPVVSRRLAQTVNTLSARVASRHSTWTTLPRVIVTILEYIALKQNLNHTGMDNSNGLERLKELSLTKSIVADAIHLIRTCSSGLNVKER